MNVMCGIDFVTPFQGLNCFWGIVARALPWAVMSLRFQRVKTPYGWLGTAVQLDRISVANAQVFVPVLTQMLESTNPRSRSKAETALKEIRKKADASGTNSLK